MPIVFHIQFIQLLTSTIGIYKQLLEDSLGGQEPKKARQAPRLENPKFLDLREAFFSNIIREQHIVEDRHLLSLKHVDMPVISVDTICFEFFKLNMQIISRFVVLWPPNLEERQNMPLCNI